MSIEGQDHLFTIYFPGFVCFVLYYAKISGERLQDHWSSGLALSSRRCVQIGEEASPNIILASGARLSVWSSTVSENANKS